MTEVLFILTTVFVAYVVYVIVNEPKTNDKKAAKPEPQKTEPTQPQPKAVAKPATPKENTQISKKTTAKAAPKSPTPTPTKSGLKDPQTGEVAKSYSNYRFTKRWIKDALVAEGLLDKVYKNNELNSEIEEKIKHALTQLEAIDKYKA